MPNVLNRMMHEELAARLSGIAHCVAVDFQGLTVEDADALRASLRKEGVQVRVVKTSLAKRVLEEQQVQGCDELLSGPTALVWGSLDIVRLSKVVNEFAKKSKTLKIKGGLLDGGAITKEDVVKLTKVPDMPVLLAGIAAGIAAPLQGVYNGINGILASVLYAIDAVREKREKEQGAGA